MSLISCLLLVLIWVVLLFHVEASANPVYRKACNFNRSMWPTSCGCAFLGVSVWTAEVSNLSMVEGDRAICLRVFSLVQNETIHPASDNNLISSFRAWPGFSTLSSWLLTVQAAARLQRKHPAARWLCGSPPRAAKWMPPIDLVHLW